MATQSTTRYPIEYGFTITKPAKRHLGACSLASEFLQRCRNLLYFCTEVELLVPDFKTNTVAVNESVCENFHAEHVQFVFCKYSQLLVIAKPRRYEVFDD